MVKYLSATMMCMFFQLSFFILIGGSCHIYAQGNNDSVSVKMTKNKIPILIKSDFNYAVNDGSRLASAPLHFKADNWLTFGAVIGGSALAFLADNNIRDIALRNHTHTLDNISILGKTYGEAYAGAIISGLAYAGGLVSGNNEVRETGRMLFETLVYAGIITIVSKSVIGRSRPYTDEGASHYRGFQFKTETTSLPSGHATVAFAVSSVLASRIDNLYASIGLYGLAGLTVFQRIYDDKHWLSDTIIGASIGTFVGRAIVNYGETGDKENQTLLLYPSFTPYGGGLAMQIGL